MRQGPDCDARMKQNKREREREKRWFSSRRAMMYSPFPCMLMNSSVILYTQTHQQAHVRSYSTWGKSGFLSPCASARPTNGKREKRRRKREIKKQYRKQNKKIIIIKSKDENIFVDVKRQIAETDRHVRYRSVCWYFFMCCVDALLLPSFIGLHHPLCGRIAALDGGGVG